MRRIYLVQLFCMSILARIIKITEYAQRAAGYLRGAALRLPERWPTFLTSSSSRAAGLCR